MFECVTPGVYEFSFQCTSYRASGVNLRHNSKMVLHSFKLYQNGKYMYSGDTMLRLQMRDKVWLEASSGITGLISQSFFSGHLLFSV